HAHRLVDRVGLAVEPEELLALPSEPRADGAHELVGIIDVQRPAAVEADVVGDVDEGIDGPQADGFQALLHPGGRLAVAHATDVAAGEAGAGVARLLGELELDLDRAGVAALDVCDLALGLEPAESGGRKVTGDAAHASAVRSVGRELHVDDRVREPEDVGVALADLLTQRGIELDDALVIVRELQLPLRYEHAVGDDAAHGARLERDLGAGNVAARRREHA